MFDVEEQMENGMHAAVDFLNADTNVRNCLINNLMQSGEMGLQEMGEEMSRLLRGRGINIEAKHLTNSLEKIYEYGVQRYIGEYDNSALCEKNLFNDNVEIDANGVDNAMIRKRKVTLMVEDLECRDKNIPNSWADFVNRGYSEIKSTIYKELGHDAVDTFEYYFNYETRDILRDGVSHSLTRAYDHTVGELQYLNTATQKLEDHVTSIKNSTTSNYASMFK